MAQVAEGIRSIVEQFDSDRKASRNRKAAAVGVFHTKNVNRWLHGIGRTLR